MNILNSYANSLGQMKNALKHKWSFVDVKYNNFVIKLLYAFYYYKLIDGFLITSPSLKKNYCRIFLKYFKGHSIISNIKTYGMPGNFHFLKKKKIKQLMRKDPKSIFFVSTQTGIKGYTFDTIHHFNFCGGLLLCCVRTL